MSNQIVVQAVGGRPSRIQNNGNNVGFATRQPGGAGIELGRLGTVQVVAGTTRKTVYWGQTEDIEVGSALTELFKANRRAFNLDGSTYGWTVQGSVVRLVSPAGGQPVAVITRGQGFTSAVNNDQGMVHWTCVIVAAVLEVSGWRGV
ncbi:hypothetical protein C8J56DRAFT_1053545 [Mycena floridula]|nr:hypothetical protein C8J56DRAFT_1053545 [Mycena floridula]